MKTNVTTWRLAFAFGLLVASVGCSGKVVEPKAAVASVKSKAAEPKAVEPVEPKAGDVIENLIKMKLVYIPPGEFDMGSPDSEILTDHPYINMDLHNTREKLHHVTLTKGYYVGVYEVTQSQFEKVLGRNPAQFRLDGGSKTQVVNQDTAAFPVECVSWFDAVEFCNLLSKSEGLPQYYTMEKVERMNGAITSAEVTENRGKGYRLPTEAEWEYACRAGTKTPFHFGDVANGKEANVDGELPFATLTKGPKLGRPREVGGYAPNKFGLYDMHGNVWEWCNDRYEDYAGDSVDPKGPDSGEFRVLRGGSFNSLAFNSRSAYRALLLPTDRISDAIGFRAARTYP